MWFAGRVQGVGFRATTVRIAKRYPVSGYVENLSDGRVRLVVEGEPNSLEQFLAELRSVMQAYIRSEQHEDGAATGEHQGFVVRR